jgi:WD40 repeat protein
VVALFVAAWAGLAQGATWVVCPTDCPYASVAEAVAAAAPGDTILVRPGTYSGDLWVTKPLHLRGEGDEPPVIEGRVYVIGAARVTMHGLTIRNGGIYVEDSSAILIAECFVDGPGGITLRSSSATLRGVTVTRSERHGILVTLGSRALIVGSVISRAGGDGIHVAASMADIRETEVRDSARYGILADEHSTIAGQAQFEAITGNAAGALGGAARVLDRVPPSAPTELTVTPVDWTAGPISIAWAAPEDLSGVAAVWYKIGAAPRGPEDGLRASDNPFVIAAPPEGRHTVYVWLEDRAGNRDERELAAVSFLADRTKPSGEVVVGEGARHVFSPEISLRVTAEDRAGGEPGSGVASMRLSNDGRTWSPWQPFVTTLNWDLAQAGGSAAPGARTVFVELRDAAGNGGRFTTGVTLVQSLAYPEPILSLAFTRVGNLLAHGSPTGVIRILSLTTKQEVRTLRGHTGGVYAIAFSPDGKLLASGSNDNTIRFWDTATGREARVLRGHLGGVWAVAFSPDGRTLASGSSDATVRLWAVPTGRHLRTLAEHVAPVRAVAFSPDGKSLASGSDDRTVQVWDPATGRRRHTIAAHAGAVRAVAFSPDGKVVASGATDGKVGLWDPITGEEARPMLAHAGGSRSVAFSPDGASLASGSSTGKVVVWSVATGKEFLALDGHTDQVNALLYSPDGRTLISAGNDMRILLWEPEP